MVEEKGTKSYELTVKIKELWEKGLKDEANAVIEELYRLQDSIDPEWRAMEIKPLPDVEIIKEFPENTENLTEYAHCYVWFEHPAIHQVNGYYETLACQFGACLSWYEKYHQQYHAYCGSHMREVYYYDKRLLPDLRIVQWGEYCTNCGWAYGPFYRYY